MSQRERKRGETYKWWMERDRGEELKRKRQRGETEGKRQRGRDRGEKTERRDVGGEI